MSKDITDEDLDRIANDAQAQELARKLLQRGEELWNALSEIESYVGLEFDSKEVEHALVNGPPDTIGDERVRQLLRRGFSGGGVLNEGGIFFEDENQSQGSISPVLERENTAFVEAGEYDVETGSYDFEGEYPIEKIDGVFYVVTDIDRGDLPMDHAYVEIGEYDYENERYELDGSYPIRERDGKVTVYLESESTRPS